ncbi:hypothetical protein [Kitasatospora camelliae]|uniref:Uncharacterized protein n=1 Tax=Kitasatospora camelliae TaxID=3156397 RepID=A0AAU8K935_9ACTN
MTYLADEDGEDGEDDTLEAAMRAPAARTVPCRTCGRTGTCATCGGTGISPPPGLRAAVPTDGRCRSCQGGGGCNQCDGQGCWHPVGSPRPARERTDPGFAPCPECHGTRRCTVCEGTAFDDEALPCSTCVGEGQVAATHGASPAMRTITFEQGHPTAPDAPWGQQILTLTTDGTLGYRQQGRGEVHSSHGRVDPARIEALLATLARTGFPAAPQRTFPPGASVTTLAVEPGGRVVIDYFVALELDGYREVIRALGDLNTALRNRDDASLAAWCFERRV